MARHTEEELLKTLSLFRDRLAELDLQQERIREARDNAIREALQLGLSGRVIGAAAGLSHPRVYKVGNSVTTQTRRGTDDRPEQADKP